MAGGDISKNVVAVLLVLAIIISIVGTWLVLDSYSEVKLVTGDNKGESNVGLQIGPELESGPASSTGGSDVGVVIQEPAGGTVPANTSE